MKQILKNTLVLLIITLISGAMLAGAYALTKEPIAKAEQTAEESAYREACPDASSFEDSDVSGVTLEDGNTLESPKIVLDANGSQIGYAVKVTTKGYGGDVVMVVGVDNDFTITGLKIISASNESPGLGANCLNTSFQAQFIGKTEGLTYSKTGAEGNEIDAISGATITTKAVTGAVSDALDYLTENFGGDGQ